MSDDDKYILGSVNQLIVTLPPRKTENRLLVRPEYIEEMKAELSTLKALVRELIRLPKILDNETSETFSEICARPDVQAIMEEE